MLARQEERVSRPELGEERLTGEGVFIGNRVIPSDGAPWGVPLRELLVDVEEKRCFMHKCCFKKNSLAWEASQCGAYPA